MKELTVSPLPVEVERTLELMVLPVDFYLFIYLFVLCEEDTYLNE